MKLISLNIWGGIVHKELIAFLQKHSDVDIFLLQEVFHNGTANTIWRDTEQANIFSEIAAALPDHAGFYAPVQDGEWGLAAFVRKSLKVTESGDVLVHRTRNAMINRDAATLGRNLQYLNIVSDSLNFTVLNFHGLWTGEGKGDTADRLAQSQNIVRYVSGLSNNIILAGDFNLLPNTVSLGMIEHGLGLRNLIKEFQVVSTRTSLYTKADRYADYIFITPTLPVRSFQVLPDEVSDHAALLVEF